MNNNKIAITCSIVIIITLIFYTFLNIYEVSGTVLPNSVIGLFKRNKDVPWYTRTKTIGHAGGIYLGRDHTNSKEAVDLFLYRTVSKDIRVLELDFLFTKDGNLVCAHQWHNYGYHRPVTHKEFMSQRKLFTPLDMNDVFKYMLTNENLYIMVDTKEESYGNFTTLDVASFLINSAPKTVRDRFIFQIYYPEQKEEMMKIYKFKNENLVYSIYQTGPSFNEVLKDIKKYDYDVVLFGNGYFNEKELNVLEKEGIVTNIFTINDGDIRDNIYSHENSIIITDYLY